MSRESKKPSAAKKTVKAAPAATSKTGAKKSPPKKAATVTSAKRPAAVRQKPAAAAKPKAKAPAPAAEKVTTVRAHANVGFGNQIFIRGEGPGLNWDRGIPMEYQDHNQWVWSAQGAQAGFPFKVLINDQHWAHGENQHARPGETTEIHPAF